VVFVVGRAAARPALSGGRASGSPYMTRASFIREGGRLRAWTTPSKTPDQQISEWRSSETAGWDHPRLRGRPYPCRSRFTLHGQRSGTAHPGLLRAAEAAAASSLGRQPQEPERRRRVAWGVGPRLQSPISTLNCACRSTGLAVRYTGCPDRLVVQEGRKARPSSGLPISPGR